jgi:hypothetical protein
MRGRNKCWGVDDIDEVVSVAVGWSGSWHSNQAQAKVAWAAGWNAVGIEVRAAALSTSRPVA